MKRIVLAEAASFHSGKPIWPEGMEVEKNLFVGFRAIFEAFAGSGAVLRIAASTLYRVFLNGRFLCHGPARGPHGYYRVDEWDLNHKLLPGKNLIAIEVAGYNVNSYYLLDQPSFLQAEVASDSRVLASTAGDGVAFEAGILKGRIQKVQRYSVQRTFSEAYNLRPAYDQWRRELLADFPSVKCAILAGKNLIPRRIPCPAFSMRSPVWHVCEGQVRTDATKDSLWKDWSLTGIGPLLKGFKEEELEVLPSIELQSIERTSVRRIDQPILEDVTTRIESHSYHILDFGTNLTGFLGARIRCSENTRLFFTFDEILTDGDVDFRRLECVNIISYELEPGDYEVESFEPYTLRYLKLLALDGGCDVEQVYLREYANPETRAAHFSCSDRWLNRIFEAGRETSRQNAVDIFMDCPSRERAGWLCDSFFAARVAHDLTGNTTIERNFFENYMLPAEFAHIPDGMLPMCYPADSCLRERNFIPNWAMWFVIQLEEYLARSGDRETVEALKSKVLRLLDFFAAYKNDDGLLEKLPGWIFVEWSKANEFVYDVNYPTNMLYAAALEAAARLYGSSSFRDESENIRNVIRQQSFDGHFFVDNAVREDRRLKLTTNRTEVCQYYAFFFGIASPQTHSDLWAVLTEHFGPRRKGSGAFPEIHMANAFVGNYLRLELLSRYGLGSQELREVKDYFLNMSNRTGTLWENDDTRGSCNHGFASHVAHVLYRDILGIQRVDTQNKSVTLGFFDLPLDWCEGRIPVGEDAVSLLWWREGQKLHYRVRLPGGFSLKVENRGDMAIIQHP